MNPLSRSPTHAWIFFQATPYAWNNLLIHQLPVLKSLSESHFSQRGLPEIHPSTHLAYLRTQHPSDPPLSLQLRCFCYGTTMKCPGSANVKRTGNGILTTGLLGMSLLMSQREISNSERWCSSPYLPWSLSMWQDEGTGIELYSRQEDPAHWQDMIGSESHPTAWEKMKEMVHWSCSPLAMDNLPLLFCVWVSRCALLHCREKLQAKWHLRTHCYWIFLKIGHRKNTLASCCSFYYL